MYNAGVVVVNSEVVGLGVGPEIKADVKTACMYICNLQLDK
jgi:hypothetical protein